MPNPNAKKAGLVSMGREKGACWALTNVRVLAITHTGYTGKGRGGRGGKGKNTHCNSLRARINATNLLLYWTRDKG